MAALHARVPGHQHRSDVAVPRVEHDRPPADHHHHGPVIDRRHRLDQRDVLAAQSKIAAVTAELFELGHLGCHPDHHGGERPESGDTPEQLCRRGVHADHRLALVLRRQSHHDHGGVSAPGSRRGRRGVGAADMSQPGPQPISQAIEDGCRMRWADL